MFVWALYRSWTKVLSRPPSMVTAASNFATFDCCSGTTASNSLLKPPLRAPAAILFKPLPNFHQTAAFFFAILASCNFASSFALSSKASASNVFCRVLMLEPFSIATPRRLQELINHATKPFLSTWRSVLQWFAGQWFRRRGPLRDD